MRKLIGVAVATALSTALMLGAQPSSAAIDVAVSVNIAPPELPVYEQPEIPAAGYIWTPGYWAWADDGSGYYWVPGTWVLAPEAGYLWTPGWWGWDNSVYLWHPGYWGTEIGFYGGVNYGFGYFGHGYDGGYWDHGAFRYNTAYTHVGGGVQITNVYNKTVINNITVNHVSFNGGNGGIQARPTQQELTAEHAHHLQPVAAQVQQRDAAHNNPDLRLSANHGHPAIAATARPGEFTGHGVIAAHGAAPIAHSSQPNNRPPAAVNTARAPSAPLTHDRAPPPEQRAQNVPPRPAPELQRAPEAPRNVEPPRPPQPQARPPQPQVEHAPPPREEQKPPAREPEHRDEPHGNR